MDGALLMGVWFASALLVFGVTLVRAGRPFPTWLVVTMVLLGPAGLLLLIAWMRGHRIQETPAP